LKRLNFFFLDFEVVLGFCDNDSLERLGVGNDKVLKGGGLYHF
jgi:hypothetical protein